MNLVCEQNQTLASEISTETHEHEGSHLRPVHVLAGERVSKATFQLLQSQETWKSKYRERVKQP